MVLPRNVQVELPGMQIEWLEFLTLTLPLNPSLLLETFWVIFRWLGTICGLRLMGILPACDMPCHVDRHKVMQIAMK